MNKLYDKKYSADFFKKDSVRETNEDQPHTDENCQETASDLKIVRGDESSSKREASTEEEISGGHATSTDDEASSEDETSTDDEASSEDETSAVDEASSEDETSSADEVDEELFKNEDKLISRLYREVVDDLMAYNKLTESTVNAAIIGIKQDIRQGHKKGFRRFPGIDFRMPVNCCGYLRRYAICHTGLVKKIVWKFFLDKMSRSIHVKEKILNVRNLKVAALGGGPGNDLVGFCSALQEVPNSIEKLYLVVVDVNKGWESVFHKILLKAKRTYYGSFSLCLNKEIRTGFLEANLTNDEDDSLCNLLGQSDVLLMVKLTSFLSPEDSDLVINNIVNSMKTDAILIFIDVPYDRQIFRERKSLDCIYRDFTKYELGFNPSKSQSPSICSCQAHVAILKKKMIWSEVSSESEDASNA